jgi:hypothetical protein
MVTPKKFVLFALITLAALEGCRQPEPESEPDTLFVLHSSSATGVDFNNEVTENDSVNPIDLEFLYNGGGVAAADFNNDGKTDLYFTAGMVSNKLYLNKGEFKFEDVTSAAHVTGEGRWANGVAVVDINNDGWSDMYISNSILSDYNQRKNLLYVNQGLNKEGIPVFKEMASEYGLADTSYSVQAAFFDYDRDGDLDMYLLTTKLAKRNAPRFFNNNNGDTSRADIDKLFRNDWNESLHHPVFTNVSDAAGIKQPGFGLGLAIADINKDGWKDIYVTNDFFGNDLLYMNNKNGTFSEKVGKMLKHTSQNAMGNDIADINNDGLADIIAVDMNPEDNYRKKKNMNGSNYNIYQNMMIGGYSIQYVRNTLQLNMGAVPYENDSVGDPVFGDVSFFSGVAETDWSWNPSLVDMDNDGLRDIIITNGYPRDVTDHDFAAFRGKMKSSASKEELIDKMPKIKISNYAYKNMGDLHFSNVTKNWGFSELSFSNGAVYADLDNDGDLDYVINNINQKAFVYENKLYTKGVMAKENFLDIKYKGPPDNIQGLGTVTEIFYHSGERQVHENFPCRGYLSSVETGAHFGLGPVKFIDSIVITWPDDKQQVMRNTLADQRLVVDYRNSAPALRQRSAIELTDVKDITKSSGINYVHRELDYIDFNEQRLLPHKLSQYGPGLAAGDINGDGLDDIFIGGTRKWQGKFFIQQKDGKFKIQELPQHNGGDIMKPENMGILFFDADNDGDLDIYFANGSNEFALNDKNLADIFLVNDGGGKMHWDSTAIPYNLGSKSCVKAADFDGDGDLDLFIGGRLKPEHYPEPAGSFIYRNDSKNGAVKFTDVTHEVAPELEKIGMVCDALWTDIDNNGSMDLMLSGEWMPVTVFKNNQGKFVNATTSSGLADKIGWWNSLAAGDFDNDGDIDYIAGNLGLNSFIRGSEKYPVSIYARDFDKNNVVDIVPTLFLPGEDGKLAEFPLHTRDDLVEQLPGLKKNFLTYKEFGRAGIRNILTGQMDSAFTLRANYFQSACLINDGHGKFTVKAMPVPFQLSPIYGMVVEDFNGDGFLDVAATGNDYGNEPTNGRYDALNGVLAYGDGKGGFNPEKMLSSGFCISGDGKALIKLRGANGQLLLAGTQNRGPLKIFSATAKGKMVPLKKDDRYIVITLKNGQKRKEEVYWGNSYLSQSSSFYFVSNAIASFDIFNSSGKSRKQIRTH